VIASYPGFPTQATHLRYPLCVCFDYTTFIPRLAVIEVTFEEGGFRRSLNEVGSLGEEFCEDRKKLRV